MATVLRMPRYGATMEEGQISQWMVAEGAAVAEGDMLCAVEIEKAVNEVPAPASGVLRKILLPAGGTAPCGAAIAILAARDEDISSILAEIGGAAGARRNPEMPRAVSGRDGPSTAGFAEEEALLPRELSATPKAVQLARELHVQLNGIVGTGRRGMITIADVKAALAGGTGPDDVRPHGPPSGVNAPAREAQAGPLTGSRRVIARRMMEGSHQAAPAAIWMDADVTDLINAYREAKGRWEAEGAHLSLTVLVLKALPVALKAHPCCMTHMKPDGSLQTTHRIDIAVAVDAPSGLVAPVVRDVDTRNLRQVANELRGLVEQARRGTLTSEQMSGHTMTVSNLGMLGVTRMHSVLNLPESVLLGLGRCEPRPVYRDGSLVPRDILPLSLTFDHRVVDGGPAAEFLRDLCHALSPDLLKEE